MAGSLDFVEPAEEQDANDVHVDRRGSDYELKDETVLKSVSAGAQSSLMVPDTSSRPESPSSLGLVGGSGSIPRMRRLNDSTVEAKAVRKKSNAVPCSIGYDMDELDDFILR